MIALRALVAAVILPAVASAATLRLTDGSRVTVESDAIAGRGLLEGASVTALHYQVVEHSGRQWSGEMPGSTGTDKGDIALAESPSTHDVFAVFARPVVGGTQLVASRWSGQRFAEPVLLSSAGADDHRPLLAFRPNGDALVVWQRGGDGTVLIRHLDLDYSGTLETFTYVDAGAPASLLPARMGPEARRIPRVASVLPVTDELAAYVLISRVETGDSVVLKLALDAIVDPGGFGAAPVPVTFIRATTNSAGSAGPLAPREGGTGGLVIEPWRMSLNGATAWYWTLDSRVDLVAFRGEDMLGLVRFPEPGTSALLHAQAYRIARTELGASVRGSGGVDAGAMPRRR